MDGCALRQQRHLAFRRYQSRCRRQCRSCNDTCRTAAPRHISSHFDLRPPHVLRIGSTQDPSHSTRATRPYPLTNDWFLDSVEPAFESVRDTVSNRDIFADACGA